jgi:hypothetical protein
MYRLWSLSHFVLAAALTCAALFVAPPPVQAGCGCTKPAPAPAAVRPNATYAGTPVTLFHSSLVAGGSYTVKFTAMNGTTASVSATAVNKRDLADAVYKNQLVVNVPTSFPLGPVGITVTQGGQTTPFLSIPDSSFTLAPQPIVVPSQPGSYNYQNYKAAVGRDGRVYISLDVTGIAMPRTFKAQALGWPLRFSKDNTVFYNTQGFLMQLANAPIPGLFSINSGSSTDSDIAQYARHEFNTYFLQHGERTSHSTDPSDANWHLDGTRHIDHNHLILTIAGTTNGQLPAAGTTPTFTLAVQSSTLFQHGLAGNKVELRNEVLVDSYTATTGSYAPNGDVFSNTRLNIRDNVVVAGDVASAQLSLSSKATINGEQTVITAPVNFLAVEIPTGIQNLGAVTIGATNTLTLTHGSYRLDKLTIDSDGTLHIENSEGPVTLYVTGDVFVSDRGAITVSDPDPEKLALYVIGSRQVEFRNDGVFTGVIYAPNSGLEIRNNGEFFGSFVADNVLLRNAARVHYDPALRGE